MPIIKRAAVKGIIVSAEIERAGFVDRDGNPLEQTVGPVNARFQRVEVAAVELRIPECIREETPA